MSGYTHYADSPSERKTESDTVGNSKDDQAPPLYTSRPSTNRSTRRSQPTAILGIIDENGGMSPDIPIRSKRRPVRELFTTFFPSTASTHIPPPENPYDSIMGPNGEKFTDVRENRKHNRRHQLAWRKMVCIVCLLVVIAAVVAIGLVIGLTRKKGHSSNSSSQDDNSPKGFPIGAWAITTYLSSVATGCTPNPATWRCYPYETYNQSSTGSQTELNWVITGEDTGNNQTKYSISSSENIFSITFSNASLVLQDQGTPDEAYHFSIPVRTVVVPNAAITEDGSTTQCFYNSSIFSANLYTQKDKTYPNSTESSLNDGEWAHAVEIYQYSKAGTGTPDCYETRDGVLGAKVDLGTVSDNTNAQCSCAYFNYGT